MESSTRGRPASYTKVRIRKSIAMKGTVSYHGVEVHIEPSSGVDDRTINHRSLKLEGVHIYALYFGMFQLLGRLLAVEIKLLLE